MIPLRELDQIRSRLLRFILLVEKEEPALAARLGDWNTDKTETIRNACTALAHVEAWIAYRRAHRRDPSAPASDYIPPNLRDDPP